MFSAEEECVDVEPTLYPIGGVEQWLSEVEKSMKNTGSFFYKYIYSKKLINRSSSQGKFGKGTRGLVR